MRMPNPRIIVGVVIAAVVLLVGGLVVRAGGDDETASRSGSATSTATVTERDLVARESFDGTLGYGDPVTITASGSASAASNTGSGGGSAGGGSGGGSAAGGSGSSSSGSSGGDSSSEALTVTALPAEGQIVNQGEALFALNAEPTMLLYGPTPAYRDLSTASEEGPDVLQLEYDLVALGLDPGTVDEEFTSATASAVEEWEEALGRGEPDGIVQLGEVVFAGGPVRVGAHQVVHGEVVAAGGPVIDVTATTRIVTLDLDARRPDLVQPGDAAEVTFSNGARVQGTVSGVGKVAEAPPTDTGSGDTGGGSGAAGSSTEEATIPVTIALPEDPNVPPFDQAPVTVGIAKGQAQGVLTVPVTALLALAGGGHGLEVVEDGGKTRIVAVEAGVYADGFVEVSGDGISAGTRVVDS
jgi:HlyD family secretion protein/Putative peptidoglycan binding domain